ncbi:L-fucose:H+ symporter permease [Leuconostoc pseudomesenteroides]|uniref:L-fucose:H+ symporter permease n=1 Tax=Leuconostoc pseudomesenteroides TaxID=33968 RepID=UPI0021A9C3CE|nr:L-fucose:H+ symporter permease [Leuconostoc pseudomesenteroides]MCT4387085.1 L-fucose:H+ symporter permease [Leuconostoc pseudomesenteroides]
MTIFKTKAVVQADGYLNKTPPFQFILLSLMFPLWGAAASLNDILITQFKAVFTLSNVASAFVQSAFYLGYFVLAIPASRVIQRTSYKVSILIGLGLYMVGSLLFFPASQMGTYSVFLIAIFVLATGLSFLETSANTYSSLLGPKQHATLRLNISQTFYPVGSILGIILGKYLIFGNGKSLAQQMAGMNASEKLSFGHKALAHTLLPYQLLLVVLGVAFIILLLTQYPKKKHQPLTAGHPNAKLFVTLKYLWQTKPFKKGILVEFFYVGMQTAVWSFTIRLALTLNSHCNERYASNFMIYAYVAFFVGKFIANLLIPKFGAGHVLLSYGVMGIVALLYVTLVHDVSALYALVLVSGLFGPGWATIYSETIKTVQVPRHRETAGAILVMSIIGGAILPLIQGAVADLTDMSTSFSIDLIAFAVVAWFAKTMVRQEREAQQHDTKNQFAGEVI